MTWLRTAQWAGALVIVIGAAAFMAWYWAPVLPPGFAFVAPHERVARAEAVPTTAAAFVAPAAVQRAPTATPPQVAPYCQPDQAPKFVLGFAQLKNRLGDTMGQPVECEHANPSNGDSVQLTTTGLAVYRKSDGALEFTDGWRHWQLDGDKLITWQGDTPPRRGQSG